MKVNELRVKNYGQQYIPSIIRNIGIEPFYGFDSRDFKAPHWLCFQG
jgi:hypothetical protein